MRLSDWMTFRAHFDRDLEEKFGLGVWGDDCRSGRSANFAFVDEEDEHVLCFAGEPWSVSPRTTISSAWL